MKLSNLVVTKKVTSQYGHLVSRFADVDVTTGLIWKKTERRQIATLDGSTFWKFTDTGEYTPGFQAEKLFAAFDARERFEQVTAL